jgi:uncharacterized protein (DUF58 family)
MTHKATFFVVGAIFLFIAGFLLGQRELLFMSCMLLAVLVTAHLVAGYSVKNLRAELRAPLRLHEGETSVLRLRVTNLGRLPKFFLSVVCQAPEGLTLQPAQGRFLPWLAPRLSTEVELSLVSECRGVYSLGPVRAHSSDPIGTAFAENTLVEPIEIIVYPAFPKVQVPAVTGADVLGFHQEHEFPAPGRGREFHFIRAYQPGDDFRRIHWKTTARTGNISVIDPERPALNSVSAFLYFPQDSILGSGRNTNLERAVKIAAGMAWAVLNGGGQFHIFAMGKHGLLTAHARHLGHLERVLEVLARTQTSPDNQAVADQIARITSRAAAPGRIAVFVGRADDALGDNLRRLALRHRQVVLFLADRDSFVEPSQRPAWLRALASTLQPLSRTPSRSTARLAHRSHRRPRRLRLIPIRPSGDLAGLVREGCLVA